MSNAELLEAIVAIGNLIVKYHYSDVYNTDTLERQLDLLLEEQRQRLI